MNKMQKIVTSVLSLILCLFFIVSIVDTSETRKKTNFDQEQMLTHIEKLSENGPRSVVDKEANEKAVEYIVATIESFGVINKNTTEQAAYLVHEYIAEDKKYQNWELKNVIVHIPANSENKTGNAIMFMGHFDSVPMGDGAADDGVACATMLEAIRYYMQKIENGYEFSNDLVFCFVNGEEYGLYGSKAFMKEFKGFDSVVSRIKFGTNLESRGTSGTLIMFETSKNNYNTVKLFAEVNKSLFTCSIATMVYDNMPNSTDFTTFKNTYHGLNMANIMGGENYHTQNDNVKNIGMSYLSQQAQIIDGLIEKLSNYDLTRLYESTESAIFFSYLNVTTVVYNHTTVVVLGIVILLMLIANVVLSIRFKKNNVLGTIKGVAAIVIGLALTAGVTYACYYLFQWIAVLFGVIEVHMVGTLIYSNTAIIIGIGVLALAITSLTTHFACKWLKMTRRDMVRAFAYLHAVLGIAISFVLADASYLFVFSGIMLIANELLITCLKNKQFENFHGELLAAALSLPLVIPVIVIAASALGLSMAYVYGLAFAISIFGVGIAITPLCEKFSLRALIKKTKVSSAEGALHILALSLAIFLCVSLIKPNASADLQADQSIALLPYDDALVYVLDANGDSEYRIYDLNAYGALKAYRPEMTYENSYYVGEGETAEISTKILSTFEDNALTIKKADENSLVYLEFTNISALSFTIDDGLDTEMTYVLPRNGRYSFQIHSDCVITLNMGTATVSYKEVLRDYTALIPAEYEGDDNMLHFNLWLTDTYEFTK